MTLKPWSLYILYAALVFFVVYAAITVKKALVLKKKIDGITPTVNSIKKSTGNIKDKTADIKAKKEKEKIPAWKQLLFVLSVIQLHEKSKKEDKEPMSWKDSLLASVHNKNEQNELRSLFRS